MLRKYVEQILNVYNYIDSLIVVNAKGEVEFFKTFRPDVNTLKEKDIIGKTVLEVYPTLTEETSSLMQVLRTGEALSNQFQEFTTYKGQTIRAVNTTMPIRHMGEVIGAVDVSRYVDDPFRRQGIMLSQPGAVGELFTVDDIVTQTQSMELVKERIRMIADTDSSVLIYGETGTGKEMVAQSIHTSSTRQKKPFVSQNCAAIPDSLLESILFGTVKGSYTGAENRAGLFEVADGGTLFLDEINSMEISMQTKLLRVIEEKKVTRVGSHEVIPIDVKIVSAVNENPLDCIRQKRLREDLFYRLSVVQLTIPPLRERPNDLFQLIGHFVQQYNSRMNRNIIGVDEEVEAFFRSYRWPGNVRELKNVIEGAFNVASARFLMKKDLPEYLFRTFEGPDAGATAAGLLDTPGFTLEGTLRNMETSLIRQALDTSPSLVQAAKKLGISKQALHYKMNKYGLGNS